MKLFSNFMDNKIRPYMREFAPYRRVLRYCRPYIARLIPAFICAWVAQMLSVVPMAAVKYVVDKVLGDKNFAVMYVIVSGVLVATVIKVCFIYINTYLMTWVGNKVVIDIRLQLYDKTQKLSFRVLYKRRIGEFISRITNDVSMLQGILAQVAMDMLASVLNVAAVLGYMLFLNWKLTIIAFMIIPVAFMAMDRVGSRLRFVGAAIQEQMAQLSAIAIEAMSAIRIVRAFATENTEYGRFEEQNMGFFKATVRGIQARGVLEGILELVQYVALVIVLMVGGFYVTTGQSTTGDLVAFCISIGTLAMPLKTISRIIAQVRGGIASAERVFEILDEPDELPMPENPATLHNMRGEISFENVSFEYEHDMPVLTDLNMRVKPGEKVAIVGVTGSGKSTIVDLILRFYDPIRGRILIDGVDLRDLDMYGFRRSVGFVPQDPVLMKGTIGGNICYGLENCPEEAVMQAAKTAGIDDFISSLPMKYESEVGERGVTLSGGQRQRVAIARAIVRNPAILLMDEATSSLDSMVESQIQGAMNDAMKGRTSVVIAHRLSTIRESDRILVISKGRIVEEGSHEELLELRGHYYDMHMLQAGNKVA